MDNKENFYGLTPDSVFRAADSLGRRTTGRFLQLNSLENRVYSLETEDGPGLVLKFYRPGRWSEAQILQEHEFTFDLAEEGFPVCAPLRFANGSSLSSAEGLFFAAWERASGRIPDEFDDKSTYRLGELIAWLHEIGFKKSAPDRVRLSAETYVKEPLKKIERLCGAQGSGLSPLLFKRYAESAQAAGAALEESLKGLPFGRIHGDLHWGNLLVSGNEIRFLDFDDCVMGPAAQDIWMLAPAVDDYGLRQRETLLAGYRSRREFDPRGLSALNPLKAARYIHYAAWVSERRDDPAFKQAFPDFGSAEYWERETEDLEKLLRDSLPRAAVPEAVTKEYDEAQGLTNKDYFWDL
jgi:Ser/Thr protein kinase RdoA (MazF antagonist)